MDPAKWNALSPAKQQAVLNQPALEPPLGVERNLQNPPNNNALIIALCTVCTVLVTSSVAIRLYSKAFVTKKVRLEEGFTIIAFGGFIGVVWALLYSVALGGLFIHQWDVTLQTFLNVLYPLYFLPLFYAFGMLFVKSAILLDWLRIFVPPGTRNLFFWACTLVLILNTIFYVAAILFLGLSCRPASKFWWPMGEGTCLSQEKKRMFEYSSAGINLGLDLLILFLPQRTIWKLNMIKKRKIAVSLAFSVGLICCVCAAGRLVSGEKLLRTTDRTYMSAPPGLWVMSEMTCAFLVFCAPIAPKAFASSTSLTKLAHSLRSWTRIRRAGSNGSGSNNSAGQESTESGRYRRIQEQTAPLPMPLSALTKPPSLAVTPATTRERDDDTQGILQSSAP